MMRVTYGLCCTARAHRELGQYDAGIEKLYRAVAQGEGRSRRPRCIHEVVGLPDSAAKYDALARGEAWIQPSDREVEQEQGEESEAWIWAVVAGVAAVLFLGFALLIVRALRRKKEGTTAETPRSKFARAVEKARPQQVSNGGGEEKALERQIEENAALSRKRRGFCAFGRPGGRRCAHGWSIGKGRCVSSSVGSSG